MSAPSSSSCEIVDLGLAAACDDDATSQIFFSNDGGGGDLSWPAAAEIQSKLKKQEKLVTLCDKYGVAREFKPVRASILGCAACETPPQGSNALCIYSDALEAGLRFPLHDFYLKLLRHYRLAPSQLVPNAWKYMAAFVLRCKDAGVEPRVSVFRYFFSVCAHKRKDKALGWHHFTPCPGRHHLFSGNLFTRKGWKAKFFFLKSPEGMPWKCPVAWGKPRMKDARIVQLRDDAIEKLKNMPCIDFKDFLSLHAPPIGALTPVPMVKPECAAASAQTDDLTWRTRRKRSCQGPGPGPASVTVTPPMHQSFAISAVPPLQGMEMTPCGTSFDGAWESSEILTPLGIFSSDSLYMYDDMVATDAEHAQFQEGNSDISMPPVICSSDSLCLYNAMVEIEAEKAQLEDKLQATDAKAAQQIAHLQGQLQQVSAANAKFMDYLVRARAEKAQLKEKYAFEIAKLNMEHASEVAKLQEEYHKASTAHAEKVKAERMVEIAKLQEKHAAEVAKLNQEHASGVAKLQEEHHKASTAHAEKVKAEHTAEITKLEEKHAAEVAELNQVHDAAITYLMRKHVVNIARVQHAAEELVHDTKKDIALALFPELDASML